MKFVKLFAVIPLIFILSGCTGEEPNNIGYITAVGIDKTEEGYLYTIQFANPTNISGGASEEGGSGGKIVENISVQAPSLYAGINNANMITSKILSLSHAQLIVTSEEVAKSDMKELNDMFSRNNDIRPDIYFAVAENAGNYLEEVKPVLELNPVKYYNLTYNKKHGNAIPKNTIADFYFASVSGDADCPLPFAGVAKSNQEEKSDTDAGSGGGGSSESDNKSIENESGKEISVSDQGFENRNKNYIAGQIGEKIKNKSEAVGMAIFKNEKYICRLGSSDAEIYNILSGTMKLNNVSFYSKDTPQQPITMRLEQKKKPRYKIDLNNKTVNIYVEIENELLTASKEYKENNSTEDMNNQTSDMINKAAEEFLNKLYKEMDVDIMGIKGKIKRKFLTTERYNEYCSDFKPSEWSFTVHTDLTMKRTGMTYYRGNYGS